MSEESKKDMQMEEISIDELEGVAGGRISFQPLYNYLNEHNISMYTLVKEGVLTAQECVEISADHNFRLSLLDKLCAYLGCQPDDLVESIPFEQD